jgi:hypothetical protein
MSATRTHIATCVFSGSLTLLSNDTERSWSIWVMKEYGAVDSWVQVQQITVDIAEEIETVLGFKKNGHVLLQTPKKVVISISSGTILKANKLQNWKYLRRCTRFLLTLTGRTLSYSTKRMM